MLHSAAPTGAAANQGQVALLADFPTKPQPGPHHHGHGHPDDTALFLDTQLVGLDLSQVTGLLDQRLVHSLALPTQAGPPLRDGALVKPPRHHDRWTPNAWASNVTTRLTVSHAVRRR